MSRGLEKKQQDNSQSAIKKARAEISKLRTAIEIKNAALKSAKTWIQIASKKKIHCDWPCQGCLDNIDSALRK